jgi:lactate dehydrogenase-like 2-hydroxyacid dehydrogenase
MKPDVLLVDRMMPAIEERLDAAYAVHRVYDPGARPALEAALPRIRAAVAGGGSGLSNDWIERLPALGIIAINGVGTDKVDLAFARARGVDVAITPDVLTDDVADLGIALMLAVLRRVASGDAFVRARKWGREPFPLGTSLGGSAARVPGAPRLSVWTCATGTVRRSARLRGTPARRRWRWRETVTC